MDVSVGKEWKGNFPTEAADEDIMVQLSPLSEKTE